MRNPIFYLMIFLGTFSSSLWAHHTAHRSSVKKNLPATKNQDIAQAKARPCAYSGRLKRVQPSFFQFLLPCSHYEYCITNEKGKTTAFLDISNLATGIPLLNLIDKTITITGQSFPHKYRGVMVIRAQNIVQDNSSI